MFGLLKKKAEIFFLSRKRKSVQAIQNAERSTSGEVRVYVESRCRFVDPIDRASEIFTT